MLKPVQSLKHEQKIKETGKTIKYRGMKFGEQKNLILAFELKDETAIINSILDNVQACTFGEMDPSKTAIHLVDFMFLKIYTATVGSKSPVVFTCGGTKTKKQEDGTVLTEPCGFKANMVLDLDKADLVYKEDYQETAMIELTPDLSIKLKVPTFDAFKQFDSSKPWIEMADRFIWSGMEAIFEGDETKIPGVDFSEEDLKEWIDSLDPTHMEKISKFFESIPELILRHEVTCPNCGGKEVFNLKGLDAFFG